MELFMGMIAQFGFNFVPSGWMACNGQLLPINQYTALFSLLGTQYGGDGNLTFALPDLRGRSGVGVGQGPGFAPIAQGQAGGAQQVSIAVSNLPVHNHGLSGAGLAVNNGAGDGNLPAGTFLSSITNGYSENKNALSNCIVGITDNVGGNQPINVQNPYLGLNFCICIEGIYPSHS
jgi:microcystin-dependent protein